ncbi:MAG: putative toxin-antitoxin system toxin component, PIN family [Bryobacterales bacterium]|nr:putative toxin-antitoxin system toxin component, PIN family [Bryobacterales bacterium]
MIRVVLDTNIIVSALLQPLGPPAEVFLMVLASKVQLCLSGSIFTEYEEVIRRPRFRRTEETVVATLEAIRAKAYWVRPSELVRACSDPDDDIFLECCQASGAAYLITGNVRDFPLYWLSTEVVTPRRFLEIVAAKLAV